MRAGVREILLTAPAGATSPSWTQLVSNWSLSITVLICIWAMLSPVFYAGSPYFLDLWGCGALGPQSACPDDLSYSNHLLTASAASSSDFSLEPRPPTWKSGLCTSHVQNRLLQQPRPAPPFGPHIKDGLYSGQGLCDSLGPSLSHPTDNS